MYGAIIGDIAGSRFEFDPTRDNDYELIDEGCEFTDDTVLTVAVANALMEARETGGSFKELLVDEMRRLAIKYPDRGYGARFYYDWLESADPKPYNSLGNGSAMRVSPCGLVAATLEEALALARESAEVTHNHPEGIKGAEAVAGAIFLAKTGRSRDEIREFLEGYYDLSFTLDEIRPYCVHDETCTVSVPQALMCFLEGKDYEDTVRLAISLGADSDTQAAIAGSIAWSFYRFGGWTDMGPMVDDAEMPHWWEENRRLVDGYGIDEMLPDEFVDTIRRLDRICFGD